MFDIEIHSLADVNFSPKGIEEIIQNVQTIVTTEKYSVPLERDFGINMNLVDRPMNHVQALLSKEITTQIERYEPRIKVTEVIYSDGDPQGHMSITVRVKLRDGVSV